MAELDRIIRKVFKLTGEVVVSDDMGPGDLPGWDSLGTIQLFNEMEKTFGFSIALADMAAVACIADLRKILKRKGIIDEI